LPGAFFKEYNNQITIFRKNDIGLVDFDNGNEEQIYLNDINTNEIIYGFYLNKKLVFLLAKIWHCEWYNVLKIINGMIKKQLNGSDLIICN